MDALIGSTVGSYRIVSVLGRGGMGVVYRAEHVRLGRAAALKVLQPHLMYDETIVQRFFNEARAASAIAHPAIVEVFDYGIHDDDRAYLVMALLQGETLTAHIEQRAIDPREVASLMAQVADGLAAAHDAGIVHRDLKPDNIMLVPSALAPHGFGVKILDFGIAKLADGGSAEGGYRTQTGYVIGTPLYMSPEQCIGAPDLDHRTDLYSLGCIAYHALAGRPPFESAAGAGAIIAAQLRDEPPDPRTFVSTIPEHLVAIVLRLLAKDPAARYRSAREVRDAFTPGSPLATPSFVAQPRAIASQPTTATGAAAQIVVERSGADLRPPTKYAPRPRALALVALALGIGGGVVLVQGRGNDPHAAASAVAPAAPVAPVVPGVYDEAIAIAARATKVDASVDGVQHTQAVDATLDLEGSAEHRGKHGDAARAAARTKHPAGPTPAEPPPIRLDAVHYARGARIAVTFTSFVRSTPDDRAWLVVAAAGKPSPGYEQWTHVEHGARRGTLFAPMTPGSYEVRFYRNVTLQRALRFTVDGGASRPPS